MTRKDYIAIARAIRDVRDYLSTFPLDGMTLNPANVRCVDLVANQIAGVMASDNANFDREHFLAACGKVTP